MPLQHKYLYYLTCFMTGFAILVFELLSFRMLSPFFGNSSIVIGTIINSILFALAVGYYLGGYIADKKKSDRLIFQVIVLSSIYMFAVYMTYPVILKSMGRLPAVSGSLLAIAILFFLPMILLSFVPPYLIRVISSQDTVGMSSGTIFSISTLGSITGGIVTTFFLIPFVGTKTSLLVSSLILFVLGWAGLRNLKPLPLFVAFVLLSPYALSARNDMNLIYQDESIYNIIGVAELDGISYLKLNDFVGNHSVSINQKTCLAGTFTDMHLFPHIFIDAEKTLILGNGAGNIMSQISCFSDTEIVGVELDPEITRVGKDYFGLALDDRKRVVHEDARVFLLNSKEKYDIIHVDLFAGNPYIPFHLATVEFFRLLHDSLSEDGVLVVNYPRFLETDPQLSDYYLGTITRVFPTTYAANEAVFSFKKNHSVHSIKKMVLARKPAGSLYIIARDTFAKFDKVETGPHIFTDDFAPVELYTYQALKR